jgi:Kef-type K+ transport system membrane component KefB
MNVYYEAAIWIGMALLASVVSVRMAVPVALVEIVVGAAAGNLPGLKQHATGTEIVTFLAGVGSILLTFLAGAEIDPGQPETPLEGQPLHRGGVLRSAVPGRLRLLLLRVGRHLHAAEIGGIALSTTSVAVVYAVMVETGLNRHDIGKLILAACFVTDLGTVLALGGFFATYGWLLLLFVAVTVVALFVVPALLRLAIARLGHRVSEPEIKLILVILFALGALGTQAGSEAVLPPTLLGWSSPGSSCTTGS